MAEAAEAVDTDLPPKQTLSPGEKLPGLSHVPTAEPGV
jgi:hypothetical protein